MIFRLQCHNRRFIEWTKVIFRLKSRNGRRERKNGGAGSRNKHPVAAQVRWNAHPRMASAASAALRPAVYPVEKAAVMLKPPV